MSELDLQPVNGQSKPSFEVQPRITFSKHVYNPFVTFVLSVHCCFVIHLKLCSDNKAPDVNHLPAQDSHKCISSSYLFQCFQAPQILIFITRQTHFTLKEQIKKSSTQNRETAAKLSHHASPYHPQPKHRRRHLAAQGGFRDHQQQHLRRKDCYHHRCQHHRISSFNCYYMHHCQKSV